MRISDWSSDVCSSDLLSQQVREAQQGLPEAEASALSVMLELQVDCLAGLWANRDDAAMQILEQGDIDEALGASSPIGDDTLQAQAQGRVTPDSFTPGHSAQRRNSFRQRTDARPVGTQCVRAGNSRWSQLPY